MNVTYANFPYLSVILLSCVAGLLIILFIPDERKTLIKCVSAIFSGITLILSAYLFFAQPAQPAHHEHPPLTLGQVDHGVLYPLDQLPSAGHLAGGGLPAREDRAEQEAKTS